MKALTSLSITLLMATGCCLSIFCADSVQKPLNRQQRDTAEREYTELRTKIMKTEAELEKKATLATQMKHAYESLQKQGYDQHAKMREEQIENWSKKEKESRNELCEYKTTQLLKENTTIFEKLKDKNLSEKDQADWRKKQHVIAHTLKELYQEEKAINPHNKNAEMFAQQFLLQSAILTQYESLQQVSTPAVPQLTTVAPSDPQAIAAQAIPPLTEVIVVKPTEDAKDQPQPKTGDHANPGEQKKDGSNCTIL